MRAEPDLVPPPLLQAVYEHAAVEYPRECCGLLLGPRDAPLDEARPCVNAHEQAGRAFRLGPGDLWLLATGLDGPHPARILYHSHVDAPACFSAEDERLALAGGEAPAWPLLHLVVEVRGGAPRGATLHAWDPASRCFREVARHETGATAAPAL
jgi:[CysO sulfur-carrier protein]-S-L-cysteine hydrolase